MITNINKRRRWSCPVGMEEAPGSEADLVQDGVRAPVEPDTAAGVVSAVVSDLGEVSGSVEAGVVLGVMHPTRPREQEPIRLWTPRTRNRLSRRSLAPWRQR